MFSALVADIRSPRPPLLRCPLYQPLSYSVFFLFFSPSIEVQRFPCVSWFASRLLLWTIPLGARFHLGRFAIERLLLSSPGLPHDFFSPGTTSTSQSHSPPPGAPLAPLFQPIRYHCSFHRHLLQEQISVWIPGFLHPVLFTVCSGAFPFFS